MAVRKSSTSNTPLPNSVQPLITPSDSEAKMPMTKHADVTHHAARRRVSPDFSHRKAVATSWREMVEVSAARASRT